MVCAQVALVPLVFDHEADWSFVVPKAMLGHALTYLAVALLVALLIRFGRTAIVWSPLHIPVLAYLGACGIATVLAVDPYLAAFGAHERMTGLATIAQWVILYFSIVLFVRSRSESTAVAVSVFGASVVVLGYEVLQVIGRDPYSWTIEGADRAFSTTGQPNALAQYASTMAVAAFGTAVLLPRLQREVRVLMLALTAAQIWGTAATDSRAPLLGLIVAALLLVVVIGWTRRGTRDAWIAAFAGLAAVFAIGALLVFSPIGARVAFTIQATGKDDIFSRVDESTAGRLALYGVAIGEFLERPIAGYGPDNFVVGAARYRQEVAPPAVRVSSATSAHSWFFQTAATTGIIGTLSFLAILVTAAVLVVRTRFTPVSLIAAATLAAFLATGLTTIDDLSTGWITWFCLGVIASSTGRPVVLAASLQSKTTASRKKDRRRATPVPLWHRVIVPMIIAAGLLSTLTTTAAYAASRSAKASTDLRTAGRGADAIGAGLAAVSSDPGRGDYWHTLGLAYVIANRFADANAALEKANRMTPYLGGYTGDLIQVQLGFVQAGDQSAKARAVDLANELVGRDPNNPLSHYYRAQTMGVTGDAAEGIKSIERALALDPNSKNVDLYRVAAQLYLGARRPQDAVNIARKGIAIVGPTQPLKDLRDLLDRALAALGLPPEARPDPDACTSTRWVATPPGPSTVGTSVIFTIVALGCQRQESQAAIQGPGASSSTLLQNGAWTAAFSWDTKSLAPGTYHVSILTRRVGSTAAFQAKYEGDYVLR